MHKSRAFNHVKTLILEDGQWCYDDDKIKGEVLDFFHILYTNEGMVNGSFPFKNYFPGIASNFMMDLTKSVSVQEVYDALFGMSPLKAPGVDGLHAQFYQSQWNVVGHGLVSLVKNGFATGEIENFFNKDPSCAHTKSCRSGGCHTISAD